DARAQVWARALRTELELGQVGAFLVWGDPALYDSTLRILDTVTGAGLELSLEVVPGITAVQVLTAAHRIPLNTIGGAVHVTTGRRLGADAARAQPGDTLVVMLDAGSAHAELDGAQWDIWWGAHLGAADQVLLAGPLALVGGQITAAKAAARVRHGWVMDTYLLRRSSASDLAQA
ncbi:MAG: precorrin-6A synthase (deacetylating), partial [Mycobacteriaceae bacterium]